MLYHEVPSSIVAEQREGDAFFRNNLLRRSLQITKINSHLVCPHFLEARYFRRRRPTADRTMAARPLGAPHKQPHRQIHNH